MSSDLAISAADRDQLRQTLAELRRAGEEFEEFVGEQLDELAAVAARLDRRERELAAQFDDLGRHIASLADSQRRLDEANAATTQCAAELRDLAGQFAVDTGRQMGDEIAALSTERERLREELEAARSQSQTAAQSVTTDLGEARAALAAAVDELARERVRLAEAFVPVQETVAAHLEALAQHRTIVEQALASDHPAAMLPAEPTAAPLPGPAAEEPVSSDEAEVSTDPADRATWWGELKQLRSKLDKTSQTLSRPSAQEPAAVGSAAAAHEATSDVAATADQSSDPVLDSVMAQFELLQRDLVRRGVKQPSTKKR